MVFAEATSVLPLIVVMHITKASGKKEIEKTLQKFLDKN